MPLAVFHAQHLLFASLGGLLWSRARRARCSATTPASSRTRGRLPSGSNAWAVGGERTATGLPLIGGDPHRIIESPASTSRSGWRATSSTWSASRSRACPACQHFAHAGDVAWAITNAMADYQDVYAERVAARGRPCAGAGADGWKQVTVEVETIPVLAPTRRSWRS